MFPSSLSPETCPNPLELLSSFFGVVVVLSPFYGLPLLVGVLLWERSARKSHPGVSRLVRDASLVNLILAPLAFGVTYGCALTRRFKRRPATCSPASSEPSGHFRCLLLCS